MNYFEFYGIPESFTIDAKAIKTRFYELSKKYHPDFYANESETKQQEILELSTLNNKAYQVLSNPVKRTAYILQQHQLIGEGEKHQLAPDFLMEMMEINESLADVEDVSALKVIVRQLATIETNLMLDLTDRINRYESGNEAGKESAISGIKDIYFKQKYLLRIKDSLNTFAARF